MVYALQVAPECLPGPARVIDGDSEAISPHLFRDIAVTEFVDCAPEEIGIAPDLLGHSDLRTTRKYYIRAHGMVAHLRVQDVIAARRRAAAARRGIGA
jgi:integrase